MLMNDGGFFQTMGLKGLDYTEQRLIELFFPLPVGQMTTFLEC